MLVLKVNCCLGLGLYLLNSFNSAGRSLFLEEIICNDDVNVMIMLSLDSGLSLNPPFIQKGMCKVSKKRKNGMWSSQMLCLNLHWKYQACDQVCLQPNKPTTVLKEPFSYNAPVHEAYCWDFIHNSFSNWLDFI